MQRDEQDQQLFGDGVSLSSWRRAEYQAAAPIQVRCDRHVPPRSLRQMERCEYFAVVLTPGPVCWGESAGFAG